MPAWCALALVCALALSAHTGLPNSGNDGYQYLSAAANILNGNGIKTSIVYFDAERAHGILPAPMTTFPPGYSLATALFAAAGIPLNTAALIVSQLSFALLPLVLAFAAPAGVQPWTFRTMMALTVLSITLLSLADAVTSDMLFTLVLAAAVLCFSRALEAGPRAPAWQAAGWLLAGCSYWIRYAGLSLLLAALGFFALRALLRRDGSTLLRPPAFILGVAAVAAGMMRNVVLTGTWKGGVAKDAASGGFSPKPLIVALYHTICGDARAQAGLTLLLLAVGLAGVALLGLRALRPIQWPAHFGPSWRMTATIVCTYCAAMLYADRTMVISFGARYFAPLVPLIFLLAAAPLSAIEARAPKAAYLGCLALILAGYLATQVRTLRGYTINAPHLDVLKAFREPASGGALLDWASAHIPPGSAVTATNGQATGYVLQRPTLSVSDPPFTKKQWDAKSLPEEMRRFRSDYLILYPGLRAGASAVQEASPFVRAMVNGDVPQGFELAARSGSAIILRRTR